MGGLNAEPHEKQNALRGGRFPNGTARRYRLTFRNVLRVRQGEEYAKWVARREGGWRVLPMCKCCQLPMPIANGAELKIGNIGAGNIPTLATFPRSATGA